MLVVPTRSPAKDRPSLSFCESCSHSLLRHSDLYPRQGQPRSGHKIDQSKADEKQKQNGVRHHSRNRPFAHYEASIRN